MSLQEAAKAIVPLVQALGQATMQELEASTKAGRRKLRFHIGQLVRHGYLERHGMGRGTYYTAR
jgi:predicted HTH transcriptional regulator